ncbi:MAG TPA: carboxypeptidase-like regulatory domain-containing protein [Polyangiales bacterium]|nr:carboxypeptidase-like regulatory domain-containing protein [Polyangiales bacterium]
MIWSAPRTLPFLEHDSAPLPSSSNESRKLPAGRSQATPHRVHGNVRRTDGGSIANAMVCASCAECNVASLDAPPKCSRTDASGEYHIDALGSGDYLISASADGYAPTLAQAVSIAAEGGPSDHVVDVVLKAGGALVSGVVMDALGGVVPNATVRAVFTEPDRSSGLITLATLSDEQGRFSLAGPRGPLDLMASGEGYAPASAFRTAPCSGVELIMTPSSRIRGEVLSADGAHPVADVVVLAQGPAWSRQQATTDEDGKFEISGLRPGIYTLRASGERWIGDYPRTVELDLVDTVDDVVIFVNRASRVEGTLAVDRQGPCTNGQLRLGAPPGDFSVPTLDAMTSREGKVLFKAVPPGKYNVSAYCGDDESETLQPLVVGQRDLSGITWSLQPRLRIEGRAVDSSRSPVAGLTLFLVSTTRVAGIPQPVKVNKAFTTAHDGSFRFRGLAAGSYSFEGDPLVEPVKVELSEATSPIRLELVVKAVGQIAVQVSTPQGEPVDGLTVHVEPTETRESPYEVATPLGGGKYRVGPVGTGMYRVWASDSINPPVRAGGATREVSVFANQTTSVEVVFGGYGGRIAGQVVDSAGAPLENVYVSAVSKALGERPTGALDEQKRDHESRSRITDSEGRFTLEGLAEDGVFEVTARRPLGGQALVADVKPGSEVKVVLPAVGSLSGLAVNAEGQPVERFWVSVLNGATKEQRSQAFAGHDGIWAIEKLSPGPLRVSAQSDSGSQSTAELTLAPGEQHRDVRLVFAPPQLASTAVTQP